MSAVYPIGIPEVTGHIDGFALRFDGAEVAVFPDYEGVNQGYRAACAALVLLREVFTGRRETKT